MKTNLIWLVLLLFPALATAANKPADYPIDVHISSSYHGENTGTVSLWLRVTINGKKLTLIGASKGLLMPGDYKAKVLRDNHGTSYKFDTTYQILYPDGKTGNFETVGISE
ncbi:MAG TPA: hypothetical protein VN684_10170 [Terriglobales bacterium]|nr:hypothetical protein [Terriglobales bacterium]